MLMYDLNSSGSLSIPSVVQQQHKVSLDNGKLIYEEKHTKGAKP